MRPLLALAAVFSLSLSVPLAGCCRGDDDRAVRPREAPAQTATAAGEASGAPSSPRPSPRPSAPPQVNTAPEIGRGRPTRPEPGDAPAPSSFPSFCQTRKEGVTLGAFSVRIDDYKGLSRPGRNGIHELAEGTIVATRWASKRDLIDSENVHLALNVASETDPAGLPREVPLRRGQTIELVGEYIPARQANARNHNGAAAVVHFTHRPCGQVTIEGRSYQLMAASPSLQPGLFTAALVLAASPSLQPGLVTAARLAPGLSSSRFTDRPGLRSGLGA